MCECNEHIHKLEGTERFGMREPVMIMEGS